MLTIRITEEEVCPGTDNADPDRFSGFLAHWGMPPQVIHDVLRQLPHRKTLLLCKPSETEEWEIRVEGSIERSRASGRADARSHPGQVIPQEVEVTVPNHEGHANQ